VECSAASEVSAVIEGSAAADSAGWCACQGPSVGLAECNRGVLPLLSPMTSGKEKDTLGVVSAEIRLGAVLVGACWGSFSASSANMSSSSPKISAAGAKSAAHLSRYSCMLQEHGLQGLQGRLQERLDMPSTGYLSKT